MSRLTGEVYSHTVIRFPGNVHAEAAPFVLLLVNLDDGKRVLGHFDAAEPPAIGARVAAIASDATPLFSLVERKP
jgi:uncharacterized OB-fold protein